MQGLNFLAPLLGISGVAVIVLAIVAIIQDSKQERKYGYRQAFYTIVALVMLVMAVGSTESLLVIGFKQVLPSARQYNQRYNQPPMLYLSTDSSGAAKPVAAPGTSAYTCTNDCQFTAGDKQSFSDWKTSYLSWRDTTNVSLQTRQDIAGSLSLLIISLPLFWMFLRWMNRGAADEYTVHNKPSPLRSIYFYGISFAGLVVAVVGGALLLNTALSTILKTNSSSANKQMSPVDVTSQTTMADSVIVCATKCNFSAADVQLVKDWKVEWQKYNNLQTSNSGSTQNDLANTIPLILVGLPLFWLHFARIRKETAMQSATPIQPVV